MLKPISYLLSVAVIVAGLLFVVFSCQKEILPSENAPTTEQIKSMLTNPPLLADSMAQADNDPTAKKKPVLLKSIADVTFVMYNNYYYGSYKGDTALSVLVTADSAFALNLNNGVQDVIIKGNNVYNSGALIGKFYASILVFKIYQSYAHYDGGMVAVPFRRGETWNANVVGDPVVKPVTFLPNTTYNY